jgi:hypothetical protein
MQNRRKSLSNVAVLYLLFLNLRAFYLKVVLHKNLINDSINVKILSITRLLIENSFSTYANSQKLFILFWNDVVCYVQASRSLALRPLPLEPCYTDASISLPQAWFMK